MRVNSKLVKRATYDGLDAGEGLSIFFSQNFDATARYRFLVTAITAEGPYFVGEFYSSPPVPTTAVSRPGRPTRMIAGALCPGAKSWTVEVSCPTQPGTPETADIILTSSKCFASEIGVNRTGERYAYHANTGTNNFTVLAGMTVTSIGAIALAGGGGFSIAGGDTVVIPAGISVNFEPKAPIPPNSVIAFVNVDWAIEFLESA